VALESRKPEGARKTRKKEKEKMKDICGRQAATLHFYCFILLNREENPAFQGGDEFANPGWA
jgi:hypothetical protein